jgi:site-specific DNA-methyltransferase (cytosine-N4-specific)
MKSITCKIKEYIQPFERNLAIQELSIVAGNKPKGKGANFTVKTNTHVKKLIESLAYWESVTSNSASQITIQSLREATVNIVRNGIDFETLKASLPFVDEIPLPNRRCLRYGTHGIHEYRGKFFPQLVRSLINISGTQKGGIVADPMSGSGTTIVEANLIGCKGLGLDMNPLSVFIGNTKCELLNADPSLLKSAYLKVRKIVLEPEQRNGKELIYFVSLPAKDQEYLTNWFSKEVLHGLDDIVQAITAIKYKPAQNLMWVSLSNIIRSVSWQKNDDLRVRKELRLDIEIDPKKEFLEELARSIRAILAFLYQKGNVKSIEYNVTNGDARKCCASWIKYKAKVDVVITSPPYATALPYLDTDRLSLIYLGLLQRPEHRSHDHFMIGNREINESLRKEYLSRLENNYSELPKSIHALIKKIEKKNYGTDIGFRRRNLPALLAKYFFDMHEVLASVYEVLKPGGMAYFVVGNNHTIAGGERIDIWTADLLADIASTLKFNVKESISMEMLVSRDIFKKNASDSEKILVFQKPNHK